MIRAFYTASSGMVAQSIKQDVIANNIANVQTPGFKRERVVTASFDQVLESQVGRALFRERPPYPDSLTKVVTVQAQSANDNTEGPIHATGDNLNFAISGPGTFEVSSGTSTQQTRNGSFIVDTDGELATPDGAKVMGRSGPIRVPQGEWNVTTDGKVMSKGVEVDQIKISGSDPAKTQVMQGYLEDSNVSVIREMVDMIANLRSFEANQRVVTSVDNTLNKLINEAGRV